MLEAEPRIQHDPQEYFLELQNKVTRGKIIEWQMPKHDEKVNSAIHSKRSNQENTEGYTYTLRKKRRDVPWQSKKGPDSEFTSGIMPMHDARHRGEKCVAESRTEHRTIRVHHKKKKRVARANNRAHIQNNKENAGCTRSLTETGLASDFKNVSTATDRDLSHFVAI